MKDAQLNLRVPAELKADFKEACSKRHKDMAELICTWMQSFIAAENTVQLRHMDGELCPLSELITGIARSAREMSQ